MSTPLEHILNRAGERTRMKVAEGISRESKLKDTQAKALIDSIVSGKLSDEEAEAAWDEVGKIYGGSKSAKDVIGRARDVVGKLKGFLVPPPQVQQQAAGEAQGMLEQLPQPAAQPATPSGGVQGPTGAATTASASAAAVPMSPLPPPPTGDLSDAQVMQQSAPEPVSAVLPPPPTVANAQANSPSTAQTPNGMPTLQPARNPRTSVLARTTQSAFPDPVIAEIDKEKRAASTQTARDAQLHAYNMELQRARDAAAKDLQGMKNAAVKPVRPIAAGQVTVRDARELSAIGTEFLDEAGNQIDIQNMPDEMSLKPFTDGVRIFYAPFSPNQGQVIAGGRVYVVNPGDKTKLLEGAGVDVGTSGVGTTSTREVITIDGATGAPQITQLNTTRTPTAPGATGRPGATAPPAAPPAAAGGLTPPPAASAGTGAMDVRINDAPGRNLPQRNNNPLNIKVGGATQKWVEQGDATVADAGQDGGNFLKFKTPELGFTAANDLLFNSGVYSNLPLDAAMKKWSNSGYGAEILPGIPPNTIMSQLNPEQRSQVLSTMAAREGYYAGGSPGGVRQIQTGAGQGAGQSQSTADPNQTTEDNTTVGVRDSRTGRVIGFTPAMYNQAINRVTPVREAANQLFGDPTQPDFKSLKDYAFIADDKEASKRLANAVRLTFDGIDQQEKSHGSIINLIKLYGGVPSAIIAAETSTMQDTISKLKPEEQEAYNAIMSAYGTVVGLRSLTKASAAQFSIKRLEQELPIPGFNSHSSRDFYDKLARLAQEVYGGARTIPEGVMPREEKEYHERQVSEMLRLSKGTGLEAPPKDRAQGVIVDGYRFPNQAAADAYRKEVGQVK